MEITLYRTRVGKNYIVKTALVNDQVHSVLYLGVDKGRNSGIGDFEGFAIEEGKSVEEEHARHCKLAADKIKRGELVDEPLADRYKSLGVKRRKEIAADEYWIQRELHGEFGCASVCCGYACGMTQEQLNKFIYLIKQTRAEFNDARSCCKPEFGFGVVELLARYARYNVL